MAALDRRGADLGLRSVMSAPLVAGDRPLGADQGLRGRAADAFDGTASQLLTLFSAQAAVLVANVQHQERAQRLSGGMREAFRTRDLSARPRACSWGGTPSTRPPHSACCCPGPSRDGTSVAQAARAIVDSAVRRRR